MKTNHNVYIAAAIVVVVLGLVLWAESEPREDGQIMGTSTSTPTNTQTSGTVNIKKPATNNTNSSKPAQTLTPTPTPSQNPIPSIPSASSLNGSTFRLTAYNGVSVPTDSKYVLSFEGGSLSAKLCNNISGNFVLDGSLIKSPNLISTQMYCAVPPNLMEMELAFISMLDRGARIYQSGNTVTLSHSGGTVIVFSGF